MSKRSESFLGLADNDYHHGFSFTCRGTVQRLRRYVTSSLAVLLAITLVFLLLLGLIEGVHGRYPSRSMQDAFPETTVVMVANETKSSNVTRCPGYTLGSLLERKKGLTATLSLMGPACNTFGRDVSNLTIEVTYETEGRLHINIFDTHQDQFTIPETVIARPSDDHISDKEKSDLVFNYEASPFAFWITRRSEPAMFPLFDTRISSLPKTPTSPAFHNDNAPSFDGFPLIFENQYLQLTSALPLGANIYGLGEVVSSSGFRRAVGEKDNGTVQTLWARDAADPVNENIYGSHPVYLEHRFDQNTNTSKSHGVFLLSANGADVLLQTPSGSDVSLVQYRVIGGVLDLYFLSGPSPQNVVEQYGALVGFPAWQSIWAFGFQLCRWGYHDINETRHQVNKMREANIPLEVMWNDIDLYHAFRDFTSDPVTFPGDQMREFIRELSSNKQKFVPIVDAAIPKLTNHSDIYRPYTEGFEKKVFITNPDGTEYIGQVWPGYTVFPDWFARNAQDWWTENLRKWRKDGIEFSGIWLDMNEASSFCDGSCGSGANLSNTSVPFILPGQPGNLVTDYPECYDSSISGPSGNITVNGTLTYACGSSSSLSRRGIGAGNDPNANLNEPPYAIHNGFGRLSVHTLATNATHSGGFAELDTHNLWGLMEAKATNIAVQDILPGKRPFLISRSTFPSAGKWTGHWLGDNFSQWRYMYFSIQGILQFNLFQIPFVGADACGFNGNTDEELCNRWMQLAAFTPFYRNHNVKGAISQEPYRWDSVANASRSAIATRYSLLPYWYTLFANASTRGTPPVRALFFEFPEEPELFGIDQQFLIGRDILVTPVLTPNATSVNGIFPGRGSVVWRDWYTHNVVNAASGGNTTLDAPLGHINVHVRDGSAILLHTKPAYTIDETRKGPYSLLVSQATNGHAFGTAYIDDGESYPPGPSRTLTITAHAGSLKISGKGSFRVHEKLQDVTLLGVNRKPVQILIQGKSIAKGWEYTEAQQKLVLTGVNVDLNERVMVAWW